MNMIEKLKKHIFLLLFLPLLIFAQASYPAPKTIILGVDGMDYYLLKDWMEQGYLPNFKRLADMGTFKPLWSSIPPQSPVAWSNFITGMDPGSHGIFDFIHRKPGTFTPYLSTSEALDPEKKMQLGKWIIPLGKGDVLLLRKGKAFWEYLDEEGIPATIFKIPSNFPPVETRCRTISGMGTPDLRGGYGTFSFFTDNPPDNADDISGGKVYFVYPEDNMVKAELIGPKNTFIEGSPDAAIPFKVYIDPIYPVAKIVIQDKEIILNVGDWSDWIQVKFEMVAHLVSTYGIVRFYLQELKPDFKLYASPVNIDPTKPALPICTPDGYSRELYDNIGFFYTQGMPEDTKALTNDIFTYGEYLKQAMIVLDERIRAFNYEFGRFKEGLLFFYFSSTDLNTHVFYRCMDPLNPFYSEEDANKYGTVIRDIYARIDKLVGRVLDKLDSETYLFIMSDHGFAPFRYSFNLNTWLLENGYIELVDPQKQTEIEFFSHVDWRRTKAYGLGLNSLYINLRGREANGIVPASQKDVLVDEIANRLLEVVDPNSGEHPIKEVYKPSEVYDGIYVKNAPDLIIGYARGYRSSWETVLGEFPKDIITPNDDEWSGDHCAATSEVPGILLSNKKINRGNPHLYDFAPTILDIYNIKPEQKMTGKSLF